METNELFDQYIKTKRITNRADKIFLDVCDSTFREYVVLKAIQELEDSAARRGSRDFPTQQEIAEFTYQSKGAISKIVRELAGDNTIRVSRSNYNRTLNQIELTNSGRQILAILEDHIKYIDDVDA